MNKLRNALVRLGEPRLQQAVGNDVVRYLGLLGRRTTPGQLADVLLERWGGELLCGGPPGLRSDLLQALHRSDAGALARELTGREPEDPWAALTTEKFTPGSPAFEALSRFFGVRVPEAERAPEIESLEAVVGGYPLHWYQAQTIRAAAERLSAGDRRVLLHMPTGAGKTRSAIALLSSLLRDSPDGAVVLWLAHSEELCDQAVEEFKRCWQFVGSRTVSVGRFYQEHELNLGTFRDGLLVAGLAKLYSRSLRQQSEFLALKRGTRLVVMDEAHQAVAPTYQHLLEMLTPLGGPTSLLGLSATPGRSWLNVDDDARLAAFFSRSKVVLNTPGNVNAVTFLQDQGYLARASYRLIPYRPTVELSETEQKALAQGLDISVETLKALGDDVQRNVLLLQAVLECVANRDRILVFSCSVAHAELIAAVLAAVGVRAAAVSAGTPGWRRREVLDRFRAEGPDAIQVLANFGVLTAGFDAPKTNTVVVARPTQSVVLYSQMIGRAMRGPRAGGNEAANIITVKDDLPGFRSVYEGFTHWEDVW